MNLVLLEPGEVDGAAATLGGRRAQHIATIHRATVGKILKVGVLGGAVGRATVATVGRDRVALEDIVLDASPPAPVACTLILALPRPRVLGRVLAAAATFGIKRVVLLGSNRVEKSYWQSPMVGEDAVREALLLGLEQAGDTVLPLVEKRPRFRPYVEDELAHQTENALALVAHPDGAAPCPSAGDQRVLLAVGPEGGFVDFEVGLLAGAGFAPVTLGERPLRVEHAVFALLGRLF